MDVFKGTGVFAEKEEADLIRKHFDETGPTGWKIHQLTYKFAIEAGLDCDFFYSMNLANGEFIRNDPMISGKEEPNPLFEKERLSDA